MIRIRRSLALCLLACSPAAAADPSRVLPEGQTPDDPRLGALRTLDDYFPFTPSPTREAWAQRAADVRRQVLVASGLWPAPSKTPAAAVIHGLVDRGEYTIERVYLQSYAGHFVTGSLYRPKDRSGRSPAVLSPHGHWADGRMYVAGDDTVERDLASGAEPFETSARSPLQARCVQLARLGCVVFHYDMVGYADSTQLVHRPSPEVRQELAGGNWGFFSPQAELRMQSMFGLQTYNSVCALDFLAGLPDVDPQRIGVTGASGGGTQTFILGAIDSRPAAAFPAVMVSTAMQGGCTCENACYLRLGQGNVDVAALFAPRPLGLSGANDWTVEIMTKGYPELQTHYAMLDAEGNVHAEAFTQFGHNYNAVARAVMYRWFNEHLQLGAGDEELVERDFTLSTNDELTVWDDDHPAPPGGDEHERALVRWMTEDAAAGFAALSPTDRDGLSRFQNVVGGAWRTLSGVALRPIETPAWELLDKQFVEGRIVIKGLLKRTEGVNPVAFVHPAESWNGRVVIWASGRGKASLFGPDGAVAAGPAALVDAGFSVASIDAYGSGEFVGGEHDWSATRQVNDPAGWDQQYAGYTYGYNDSLPVSRARDLLALITFIRGDEHEAESVSLVAVDGAAPWATVAAAVAEPRLDSVAIDAAGFRFADVPSIRDPNFLPGAVKYGDLPGLLALAAPARVQVVNLAPENQRLPRAVHALAGGRFAAETTETPTAAIVERLLAE